MQDVNVTFYINSTNGSYVYDLLSYKSHLDKQWENVVMFPSGAEFLICKVEKRSDAGRDMIDVYLRNVSLGLSPGGETFFWLDDEKFNPVTFSDFDCMLSYRYKKMESTEDQGV